MEYKIINLTETNEDNSNIKTLIAELAVIEDFGVKIFSPNKTEAFIFDYNSTQAQNLIQNPESNVNLSKGDFFTRPTNFKDYENAFYEANYWNELRKVNFGNYTLDNEVDDCISHFHPEMYFSVLLSFITKTEYELEENVRIANNRELFEKWKKLSSLAFRIACKIEDKYHKNITESEIQRMLDKYYKVLEFAGGFDMAIGMYFCYRDDAERLIQEEFGKTNFQQSQTRFYEICMDRAKRIAEKRIEQHLNSEEYFGLEYVETPQTKVYKLFLTPKGFLHKEVLVNLANSNKIDEDIEKFLSNKGLKKINDTKLKDDLETELIMEDNQSQIFYYKRRIIGRDGQSFNQQSLKGPINALLGQGQLNLTYCG